MKRAAAGRADWAYYLPHLSIAGFCAAFTCALFVNGYLWIVATAAGLQAARSLVLLSRARRLKRLGWGRRAVVGMPHFSASLWKRLPNYEEAALLPLKDLASRREFGENPFRPGDANWDLWIVLRLLQIQSEEGVADFQTYPGKN